MVLYKSVWCYNVVCYLQVCGWVGVVCVCVVVGGCGVAGGCGRWVWWWVLVGLCNGLSVMSGCMGGVCWWVWMLDLSREGRCK